jgi:PEP-CTERM/exosortase A-associated glycosyltransferase
MITADRPRMQSVPNRDNVEIPVLHVLDHSFPVLSGYSVRSRNLIAAQHRIGESVRVVTGPLHEVDDSASGDMVLDGVSYARTSITSRIAKSALQGRWPIIREWEVIRLLRRRILNLLDLYPARVIYSHSPVLCGVAAMQAARKKSLPFVYEIRAFWEDAAADQNRGGANSVRFRLIRQLETFVARNADAVSAIATPMLKDLEGRGIPAKRLFHVPNGVDVERFKPREKDQQLRKKLGLGEGPVFAFVGSLYKYEGISWMIRAAATLRTKGYKFQILIIGKGEEKAAIEEAIRECNAFDYVHWIDHVPYDQICRYYSIADIAVYPRRSIRLTELVTPLKPLEAMAQEIPVLGSFVGGIRELVQDERTGLLFKPEDVTDFGRQAERLILSPSLRKSLGKRGRDFVVRERNWDVLAQRYRKIYEFVTPAKVE